MTAMRIINDRTIVSLIPLTRCSRKMFFCITIICFFFHESQSFVGRVGKYGNQNIQQRIRTSGSDSSLDVSTVNPLEHNPRHATLSSSEPRAGNSNLNLPVLSKENKKSLALGERVQMQYRDGRSGRGMVVLDVQASPEKVFELLTKFNRYDSFIPTVRSVNVYGSSDGTNSATFSLSKFCLKVNVVHTVVSEEKTISFTLDKQKPNLVMRQADGFWHVQAPADRPDGYSRVYLSANIVASRVVPTILVDYAAARALPRATTWLQTHFI